MDVDVVTLADAEDAEAAGREASAEAVDAAVIARADSALDAAVA